MTNLQGINPPSNSQFAIFRFVIHLDERVISTKKARLIPFVDFLQNPKTNREVICFVPILQFSSFLCRGQSGGKK